MMWNSSTESSPYGDKHLLRAENTLGSPATDAMLEFGRFRVLLRRRKLLVDGVPIELGTRAFDLLVVLAEANGSLVPKRELMTRVWPGVTVCEESLKVQVSNLRRALGEDRDLIHTEFGRGYRLTAAVRSVIGRDAFPLPAQRSCRRSGCASIFRRPLQLKGIRNGRLFPPPEYKLPRACSSPRQPTTRVREICVRPKLGIGAAIALLAANAGALAQSPRESPFPPDHTSVSALLRGGWEIKAVTEGPNFHSPVIVLQKGGQAAWCVVVFEDMPPPPDGTPPSKEAAPPLETGFCRELQ
jgi:DNA-binding winged helix-turn-helix (wHTH) protein